MTKFEGKTVATAVLTASLLCPASAAWSAEPTAPVGDYESRHANVERLVEQSSGAKNVAGSGNARARALHAEARDLLGESRVAAASGDRGRADELLHQATTRMFEAIRLASGGRFGDQKHRSDFQARKESVEALLEALDRIAREKGEQAKAGQVKANVDMLVGRADGAVRAGRVDEGRRILDGAYEMTKVAVEDLRGGDTLVRTLHFETEEEEYLYELDRNDTHRMLIDVLLEQKLESNEGLRRMVDGFVGKAERLRAQAEREAGSGDHAQAIRTLEASTAELVRAIRSAGVYIPG
ncbi:MAG: hypothetical protein PVF91_09885 [Chromatiales bacterium]|jgi:hypothetical protein